YGSTEPRAWGSTSAPQGRPKARITPHWGAARGVAPSVGVDIRILRGEADRLIRFDDAFDASRMPEMIEMRDRFAHREKSLLHVERPAKQHGYHVGCRLRRLRAHHSFGELVQTRCVMRPQLRNPQGNAAKW